MLLLLIVITFRGVILCRTCVAGCIWTSTVVLCAVGITFRDHNHPNTIASTVCFPTTFAIASYYLTVIVCIRASATAGCSMGYIRIWSRFFLWEITSYCCINHYRWFVTNLWLFYELRAMTSDWKKRRRWRRRLYVDRLMLGWLKGS